MTDPIESMCRTFEGFSVCFEVRATIKNDVDGFDDFERLVNTMNGADAESALDMLHTAGRLRDGFRLRLLGSRVSKIYGVEKQCFELLSHIETSKTARELVQDISRALSAHGWGVVDCDVGALADEERAHWEERQELARLAGKPLY